MVQLIVPTGKYQQLCWSPSQDEENLLVGRKRPVNVADSSSWLESDSLCLVIDIVPSQPKQDFTEGWKDALLALVRGGPRAVVPATTSVLVMDGLSGEILVDEGATSVPSPVGSVLKPFLVATVPAFLESRLARGTVEWRCDVEAGMAKLVAARLAWSCADNALQIHGGNGYAIEYPISRVLCDARILNIFEGAAEIQAHIIARGLLGRGK